MILPRWCLLGALLIMLLGGCAQWRQPPVSTAAATRELTATPFFPQQRYQCGPAALATLLVDSGVDTTPDQLAPLVYLPKRAGSLQPELIAASRHAGRMAYLLEPRWQAIDAELAAGRPVLVLQNLGLSFWPVWHYAVVIGHDPRRMEVILRSGTERRQTISMRRFLHSWQGGGNWAVVVLKPGELPVAADAARYLAEVAVWESQGRDEAALRGYLAALERWPNQPIALLGAGNISYGRHDYVAAAGYYRALLGIRPDHPVALNNLADTLARVGCRDQALDLIERGLRLPDLPPSLQQVMGRTLDELNAQPAIDVGTVTDCAAFTVPYQ